jgi:putative glutathione S-transferase
MGKLVNGAWSVEAVSSSDADGGEFERETASFRNWITPGGEAGPTGDNGFPAEPGRYHLYVSMACPWAHRTLIARLLKGLRDFIGVSVTLPVMGEDGWEYPDGADPINGVTLHRELYLMADARFSGRASVPVLWDRAQRTIVNNESADILRMFNSAFDAYMKPSIDLCPEALVNAIDALNKDVYERLNNGVYRAGFAKHQRAYDSAFDDVFACLDAMEMRLARQRYLFGHEITETDIRLFTTLIRFDAVYYLHFKCNRRRIFDYPNLSAYLRDLFQRPAFHKTVDIHHIMQHYYRSHPELNPRGIVPRGPKQDLSAPHGRERL